MQSLKKIHAWAQMQVPLLENLLEPSDREKLSGFQGESLV